MNEGEEPRPSGQPFTSTTHTNFTEHKLFSGANSMTNSGKFWNKTTALGSRSGKTAGSSSGDSPRKLPVTVPSGGRHVTIDDIFGESPSSLQKSGSAGPRDQISDGVRKTVLFLS